MSRYYHFKIYLYPVDWSYRIIQRHHCRGVRNLFCNEYSADNTKLHLKVYSFRVFHINWSLSDSKSPQVSRTILSILVVLNNIVVWLVSTRLPSSKSSSFFNDPFVIVPKAPITIGTIVTFMFHSFFNSQARSNYLSFFSHSFNLIL